MTRCLAGVMMMMMMMMTMIIIITITFTTIMCMGASQRCCHPTAAEPLLQRRACSSAG